jgi:hypothetical protein
MKARVLLPVCTIAAALIAGCSGNDALVDAQIATMGRGTIRVTGQDKAVGEFVDFKLVKVTAQRIAGACHWENSLSSSPGELPVAAVQLAFNPNTCEQLLKVGHIRHRQMSVFDSRYSYASSSAVPAP